MEKHVWHACWYSCAMMVDTSLDIGFNWSKTSGRRAMLVCCTGTFATAQNPMEVDFLLVMWCYHRCAFLLDSIVCNYSIVPDGDQTAGLRSIEEVERKVQQRLLLLA